MKRSLSPPIGFLLSSHLLRPGFSILPSNQSFGDRRISPRISQYKKQKPYKLTHNNSFIWILYQMLLIFLLIFIEVQLLYNVVLVFPVQQNESAIHVHISSFWGFFFPFTSPQSTEFLESYSRFSLVIHLIPTISSDTD